MLALHIERCQSRMMKEQLAVEKIVGNLFVNRLHLVQMTKRFLVFSLDLWNILLQWFLCILVKKKRRGNDIYSLLWREGEVIPVNNGLYSYSRDWLTWEDKTKTHPMLFCWHPLPPFRLGAWSSAMVCDWLCLSSEVHLLWNCGGQRPQVTHSYQCHFTPFYL